MATYSDFENEIRHPGPGLMAAVEQLRAMSRAEIEDNWDKLIALVDEGIHQDLGWTRADVEEYFSIYSDCFKDANGFRPRWDYDMEYYDTVYTQLVLKHGDSTYYSDYGALEEEVEEQEAYQQNRFDQAMDGVTLNGEKPNIYEVNERCTTDELDAMDQDAALDWMAAEDADAPEYRVHHARLTRTISD